MRPTGACTGALTRSTRNSMASLLPARPSTPRLRRWTATSRPDDMSRRPAMIPAGSWPPRMNADMAAGYCGEKHVEDFLERVGSQYPEPKWVESQRRRFWSRLDLDRAIGI